MASRRTTVDTLRAVPINNKSSNPSYKFTEGVNIQPLEYGVVDNIRVICYPYREYKVVVGQWSESTKAEDRETSVNRFLKSFRWREEAERLASVEATLVFHNEGDFARKTLKPGTWLQIQYYNTNIGAWIELGPQLYIWGRSRTDSVRKEAVVTAFDVLSLLNRQDVQNWQFKSDDIKPNGWYAHEIAETVLKDLAFPGTLAKTKRRIPYMYLQNHNPFEVILKAYTRDRQLSNTRYRIQAVGRKVVIEPYTKQKKTWKISASSNEKRDGGSIFNSEWDESLDGLYTEVVVISQSSTTETSTTPVTDQDRANAERDAANNPTTTNPETGTQTPQYSQNVIINAGARAVSHRYPEFGTIRNVVYLDKEVPSEVLKIFARRAVTYVDKLNDEITITTKGLVPMRAGDAVIIDDPKGTTLRGQFFVSAVAHNIESGIHTMDLTISRAAIVPTLYPTREELVPANQPIGIQDVRGPGGLSWFPPLGGAQYEVVGSYGGSKHSGGKTWMDKSAVDVKLAPGSPIFAPVGGYVVYSGYPGLGTAHTKKGHAVLLSAGSSGPTIYVSGMVDREAGVVKDRSISKGDILGYAGSEPIHFALSKGGPKDYKASFGINPTPYLKSATSGTAGSNSNSNSTNSPANPMNGPTADRVNEWIKKLSPNSPMNGMGEHFIKHCTKNNINADFLVALGQMETGLGTTGQGRPYGTTPYNAFGFASNNTFSGYPEAIKRAAEVLKRYYFSEGRYTIATIIAKYSPPGAANDPNGTNAQHPYNIAKVMERMGYSGGVNIDVRLNR
jgi:murein DD-endopeptidase MepM/ murein hydrolase activator NlpD